MQRKCQPAFGRMSQSRAGLGARQEHESFRIPWSSSESWIAQPQPSGERAVYDAVF